MQNLNRLNPHFSTYLKRELILILLFFALGVSQLFSQTLNKPVPADNPNIAGNSPWTAACASADFNEYYVNFTWNTPLVASNNEFILELSDSDGSFANATELATDAAKNTNFNFEFSFALPTDTRGDNYRFRVRSTSPALTSPESDAFEMYYVDHKSPLLISHNGDGNIPTGGSIQICDGNPVNMAVHNLPNPETYQYNWYRSGTLLAEKSHAITVSQDGIYVVELDYGATCSGSANTLSNDITITTGTASGVSINTPGNTDLCPADVIVLEANILGQDIRHAWYKDGVIVSPSAVNNQNYTINSAIAGFDGVYTVEISGSGFCLEQSAGITITDASKFTITRVNEADIIILPSETKVLTVATDADTPTYQWYKDNTIITGETNNTITITEAGEYYASVTQSGGSCVSAPINSETTTVVSPASFEVIVDYTTAYTSCESTDVILGVTQINSVAADNTKTDITATFLNNFTYQWKKDGVNVAGATNNTISLTDISENGAYEVDATLATYNPASNELTVELLVNETITITSNETRLCDTNESIAITTAADLTTDSFEWFRDGVMVDNSNAILNANEAGSYHLVVNRNGCPLTSDTIVIDSFSPTSITVNATDTFTFPETGSRTVIASGGDSYEWYDSNNTIVSNTPSLVVSEEGNYNLVVTAGSCQVSRQFTAVYESGSAKIPNVITINGDGINDLWVIPTSYAYKQDINVAIYNDRGEEVYNVFNYQNNWPQSSASFAKQNMVFYYKIRDAKEVLKQGTITIIR